MFWIIAVLAASLHYILVLDLLVVELVIFVLAQIKSTHLHIPFDYIVVIVDVDQHGQTARFITVRYNLLEIIFYGFKFMVSNICSI
jgi:hypothetical protein